MPRRRVRVLREGKRAVTKTLRDVLDRESPFHGLTLLLWIPITIWWAAVTPKDLPASTGILVPCGFLIGLEWLVRLLEWISYRTSRLLKVSPRPIRIACGSCRLAHLVCPVCGKEKKPCPDGEWMGSWWLCSWKCCQKWKPASPSGWCDHHRQALERLKAAGYLKETP